MEWSYTASQEIVELRSELIARARQPQISLLALQPLVSKLGRAWQRPGTAEELAAILDGDWELLYASKPALASFGLDAFPGIERTKTYQCIDVGAGRVYNLAQLHMLFGIVGTVLVGARFELEEVTRLRVRFEQTAVVLGGIAEYGGSCSEAIRRIDGGEGLGIRIAISSEGTLETLYADPELRVGLGNRGTIFVLVRP